MHVELYSVAFSDGFLSLSHIHLRFLYDFSWLDSLLLIYYFLTLTQGYVY